MRTITLNSTHQSTMKLNMLGKVAYTLGFASGTVSKCVKASGTIIKNDYKHLRINLKQL